MNISWPEYPLFQFIAMLFEPRFVLVTVSYTVPTAHSGVPEFGQFIDSGTVSWILYGVF